MKKVAILQSNYIPWKGYFDLMNQVDDFVIYDVVQYTKRDWRNRNRIITPQGLLWLSIPVVVNNREQRINETKVIDTEWSKNHLTSIKHSYSKSKYFNEYYEELIECYSEASKLKYLSEINLVFIQWICKKLNINTTLHSSSDFELSQDKSERLAHICSQLSADVYLSGPAAKDYLDESRFSDKSITVEWMNYNGYPEYQQFGESFEHAVSVLDLIFHLGTEARQVALRKYFD